MNSLKVLIITSKIWKRALVSLLYLGRNTSSLILVENTCEYCEIYKNSFFCRTPLLAVSKMNYSSNLDRYYYSHLQIHSLFLYDGIIVFLWYESFVELRQSSIKNKPFKITMSTKSKYLFTSRMDRKI